MIGSRLPAWGRDVYVLRRFGQDTGVFLRSLRGREGYWCHRIGNGNHVAVRLYCMGQDSVTLNVISTHVPAFALAYRLALHPTAQTTAISGGVY